VESYHSWAAWIERSTDNGKTWTRHGPIESPAASGAALDATHGIIQPVVVPIQGKHLRLYARSTATIGRICTAESVDGGITWSKTHPLDLPNPNSGIDALRLKDGRFVMIYNHTAQGRTPLNLAVSTDGEHWTPFYALETEPGEYSYPAMIQGSDGSLHITYTWRRQRIKYVNWPLSKITIPK
jgi:predicted neuraminidase